MFYPLIKTIFILVLYYIKHLEYYIIFTYLKVHGFTVTSSRSVLQSNF